MTQKNPKYFISRAAHDSNYAAKISDALAKKGWHTFTWQENSPSELISAKTVQSDIFSEIDNTDFFIFIVPPYEGMGQVALMELGAAIAKKKNIIPILPSNARYESARPFIDSFNIMNANDLTPGQVADRIIALAA